MVFSGVVNRVYPVFKYLAKWHCMLFYLHCFAWTRGVESDNKLKSRSINHHYLPVGIGPKNFPLDCRMAIFYSTVEDNVAPSASILCQISSLVSLNLLAQVTSDDQIDCPKYKCLVNFLTISEIAKQLKFDIVQYLYDFV